MVLKTKRKDKEKKLEVFGVPEPVRVSALDIVINNLQALGRTTFLHRLMYVAEHTFEMAIIPEVFETINNKIHKTYIDEKITGFMLYYPKFIVMMVEGSMYSISKHIGAINKYQAYIKNFKVMLILPNINQRFTNSWTFYTDTPGTLLEKVTPETNAKATMSLLANCIKKMYELIYCVIQISEPEESQSIREQRTSSAVTLSSSGFMSSSSSSSSSSTIRTTPKGSSNDLMLSSVDKSLDRDNIRHTATRTKYLPEYDLLAYLVNSKYLYNFDYLYLTWHTPANLEQNHDSSWPYPAPIKPINIFEPFTEPECELPHFKWQISKNFPI